MSAEIRRLLEKCHEFVVGVNIEGHGEEFWEDVRGKLCDELEDFLAASAVPPPHQEQETKEDHARGPSPSPDSTTGSPRNPQPDSSLRALVELVAEWRDLTVAPEPRAIATTELLETSPQTARRDWWREGWALAVQECAEQLEAVLLIANTDDDAGETQDTVLS